MVQTGWHQLQQKSVPIRPGCRCVRHISPDALSVHEEVYPHTIEIFAEYTEAADPVGMIRCTFVAAFLTPVITEILGNPLFSELMLTEKLIDPAECGSLGFIFESQGLF